MQYRSRPQYKKPHHSSSAAPRRTDENEQKFLSGVAIDPTPRIRLEKGSKELTMRGMDLITPIGMGQRGLIVAPPGCGKTTFLKHICQAVTKGTPEIKLFVLLIDERPEEVTEFKRSVDAQVFSSSCDESYENHIKVAEEVMKQAFALASQGQNVMIVIDSLTRLARVHNARSSGNKTMSGGVDSRAMEIPRRIFGAARKIEGAGSLSILATILVDTGSRMDQVIFEEFKGTGNMEIFLSRDIAQHRIFPAIDIAQSATRKVENLLGKEELEMYNRLRKFLAGLNKVEAAQALVKKLTEFPTNEQVLLTLK